MRRSFIILLACLFVFCMSASSARGAWKYDPEIKEYLEKVKERRKEEKRKEREERRADPHRRLRPYQTLEEINKELDKLLSDHAELFTGGTYGKSVEGRDLRWIRMNTGEGNDKPQMLLSANIHAQEMAAGQMVMYLLRYFAENYGCDCKATRIADSADIYFVPVMNPDQMAKAANMQSEFGITTFLRKNKRDVDLNRNFPYPEDAPDRLKYTAGAPWQWFTTYRGPEPLSEPESRAFIEFVDQNDFLLSLNYHTTGGMILYSPGTYPDPMADTELMKKMALAYQAEQFDEYDVHPAIELYPTLGALDDYLYHRYGILAFTVEVGNDANKRAWGTHNGTFSPVFWAYNVYELEQEAANNLPGALALIEYALKVHNDPEMMKWEPSEERWVGEPPKQGVKEDATEKEQETAGDVN